MDLLKSAVESGDLHAISEILNEGSSDDCHQNSYEILNYVIQHRSKEIVLLLIDKGFAVNKISGNHSTPLHYAADRGCADVVQALLSRGASVDAKDEKNNTPLMIAFVKEDQTLVDLMLPYVRRNHFSGAGLSHVHIACARSSAQTVKRFLQLGVKVDHAIDFYDPRFGGYTPLHFAASHDNLESVQLLMSCGAVVSLKDAKGMTALHVAFKKKNRDIVDAILSAHVYDNSNPEDPERLSHFHIACTTSNPRIVEAFLKHDENNDQPTIMESRDHQGFTPLHFAVDGGCEEVVNLLLDYNADVTIANKKKMRPAEYAISLGKAKIAELIQSREKVQPSVYWILKDVLHIRTDRKDELAKKIYRKRTPALHVACTHDILSAVITVVGLIRELKDGQTVNQAIEDDSPIWPGCTPLHLAVEYNNATIADELLNHGADASIKDSRGLSPLHLAFRRGRRTIVDLILAKRNLHPEDDAAAITDPEGLSHFHVYCTAGDSRQVEAYLARRPEAVELRVAEDSSFRPGYEGLHFAVQHRAAGAFRALLAHGASVTARTGLGLTPLDVAAEGMAASADPRVHLAYLDFVEAALAGRESARGLSLLHIACARGDLARVRDLATQRCLNERVDEDLAYWAGYTPLHVTVEFRHREVAEILLSRLARVNVRDARGNTPLHLLLASAYPFFKPQDYRTSDRQREFAGWLDMLLDAGADINLRNYAGETLQHLSCKLDYRFSLTEIILKRGADVANLSVTQLPQVNDRSAVIKHVTLLNVLGVNLQNHDERYKYLSRDEREVFESNCLKELERMKNVKINYRLSLYDILSVDAEQASALATNDELRRIVDSEDFDAHFEIYGFLIKLLFKKLSMRRDLMDKSEKSLFALTGLQMPVSCHETIYKYLDNEDLRNVFRAYNLGNEKGL